MANDLMALRMEMAAEGWESCDQLTTLEWGDDMPGYHIFFWRPDWHGRRTAELIDQRASYGAFTSDPANAFDAAKEAAAIARRAWAEFPDCPPYKDHRGELVRREPISV